MHECFGIYGCRTYCDICVNRVDCKKKSNNKEARKMGRNETHDERKERLDEEWLKNLPCYGCNPKMQKLCKYYNTFKRPDYNQDQFHIVRITCNDMMPQGLIQVYSEPTPVLLVPVAKENNFIDPAAPSEYRTELFDDDDPIK